MKRQIISLGLMLAATFSLTNCAKEINTPVAPEAEGTPFEIVASVADTKTANNEMKTAWVANDAINLFHAVTDGTTYVDDGKFSITEANLAAGKFTGTVNGTLDVEEEYDWFAFYPYSSYIKTPANTSSGYMPVGCKSNEVQTQKGNNSMSHIAGANYPLAGRAIAVPGGSTPTLAMSHVSSLLEIVVTNTVDAPLEISEITFTAPTDIVGTYYINFAGDIAPASFKGSDEGYVSPTAVLNVTGATALAKGESAKFYLAVRPFVAEANSELTLSVNGYPKTIKPSATSSFNAGKIKTLNFSYDKVVSASEKTCTWDLTKASHSSASTTLVKWISDDITMELAQKTSKTAANNYLGGTSGYTHTRVYKDQILTFTQLSGIQIQKIEITAVSGYMDELQGATWTNGKTSVAGLVMTVVPNDVTSAVSVKIGSATRFTSVKVYYTADENYVPPVVTLESISVSGQRTDFVVGDTFEFGGIVTATYSNGTTDQVTPTSVSTPDMTEGEHTVTVTYVEDDVTKTVEYKIQVSPASAGGVPSKGTILWQETWADAGANSTTFADNTAISAYNYAGRTGYEANATSVTYTADASNNVRITKSSGGNCTSGHLWFNKSVAGELKTSAINLYGATSLTFSHSQGTSGSSCQTLYSINGGSTWTSLGTQSGAIATKTYTFTVPDGTESIMIKLVHVSTNSKNTRVDNLVLKVN